MFSFLFFSAEAQVVSRRVYAAPVLIYSLILRLTHKYSPGLIVVSAVSSAIFIIFVDVYILLKRVV